MFNYAVIITIITSQLIFYHLQNIVLNTSQIMQDELVRRGKANPNTLLDETPTSDADGLNVIALRDYELSKLRYYFAIAVLDSVATSEALYEALDGVELEHSSMTFDLRFVPEDADFTARTVRDHCTGAAISVYTPPDFIVNALQHTNVKCTWDEGDTARARKLGGTLAQWKDLAESDIQQFLASESENESDGEHDTHETKRKDNKSIRKLLLGQNDEDSNADSDIENDDFFRRDDDAAASKDASSDNENDENKVYTYFSKDKSSKADEPKKDETPFEALQRKMAEKKKARKQAKKDLKAQISGLDKSAIAATILKKLQSTDKKKNSSVTNPKAVGSAELELMFDTQDENDYNMRSVQKEEKLRKKQLEKGSKKKRGRTSEEAEAPDQATFKVDLKDNRFNRLIAGDSHFGIDPMSSDFKETQGMRDILAAQRKRRKHALSANPSAASETSSSVLDIAALKNKFQAKSKK